MPLGGKELPTMHIWANTVQGGAVPTEEPPAPEESPSPTVKHEPDFERSLDASSYMLPKLLQGLADETLNAAPDDVSLVATRHLLPVPGGGDDDPDEELGMSMALDKSLPSVTQWMSLTAQMNLMNEWGDDVIAAGASLPYNGHSPMDEAYDPDRPAPNEADVTRFSGGGTADIHELASSLTLSAEELRQLREDGEISDPATEDPPAPAPPDPPPPLDDPEPPRGAQPDGQMPSRIPPGPSRGWSSSLDVSEDDPDLMASGSTDGDLSLPRDPLKLSTVPEGIEELAASSKSATAAGPGEEETESEAWQRECAAVERALSGPERATLDAWAARLAGQGEGSAAEALKACFGELRGAMKALHPQLNNCWDAACECSNRACFLLACFAHLARDRKARGALRGPLDTVASYIAAFCADSRVKVSSRVMKDLHLLAKFCREDSNAVDLCSGVACAGVKALWMRLISETKKQVKQEVGELLRALAECLPSPDLIATLQSREIAAKKMKAHMHHLRLDLLCIAVTSITERCPAPGRVNKITSEACMKLVELVASKLKPAEKKGSDAGPPTAKTTAQWHAAMLFKAIWGYAMVNDHVDRKKLLALAGGNLKQFLVTQNWDPSQSTASITSSMSEAPRKR